MSKIYLPGGYNSPSIEVFDLISRCFLPELNVHLKVATHAIAWMERDRLVVVSGPHTNIVTLEENSVESRFYYNMDTIAIAPPVLLSGTVYYMCYKGCRKMIIHPNVLQENIG